MNKEEFKNYLNSAIESLTEEELQQFSVKFKEPDLETVARELLALKGEVKKMNTVSLKLFNEINIVVENSKKEKIELESSYNEEEGNAEDINKELRSVLERIIEQDELIRRTNYYFAQLPALQSLFTFKFSKQYAAWKEGYSIQNEKWEQFILNIGIIRTGIEGDMFNPEYHEAIEKTTNYYYKNGQITDTTNTGYLYKNILIKRAKVTVNKSKFKTNKF